jgi:hypothetical protein
MSSYPLQLQSKLEVLTECQDCGRLDAYVDEAGRMGDVSMIANRHES